MAKAASGGRTSASALAQLDTPFALAPLALETVVRRFNASTVAVLKDEGLNLEQWRVLDCLVRRDEMPMTGLADAVVVPAPTLTRIVDKLVSRALVYRSSAMSDRRRVLVHASKRGEDLHRRLAPRVAQIHASILDPLTPGQQRQFLELLQALGEPR